MGGGPSNIQGMMRQAQKLQEDMQTLREDLDSRKYEIKAGGGAVTVSITGKLLVESIVIDEDLVDPEDIETLQDTVVAAVNEAIKTVNDTNESEMNKLTGSLNMPGLPGMF